jgi:hypothetical protein
MTWTPPGPCDPRTLADRERHGRSLDEQYDRELERADRDAERASLPPGHPAVTRPEGAPGQDEHPRP